MNNKLSPRSYLKNNIFDKITTPNKKKKLPGEFKIISMKNYEDVIKYQYKVPQLKEICTFYKLKKSGNKDEITSRIYNFLKYSLCAVTIQGCFRRFIRKEYINTIGPAYNNKKVCVNETDFASLEPINEISYNQFYSFKDKDDNIYGCDILSIYEWINLNKGNKTNKTNIMNPYTRHNLPDYIYNEVLRHIVYSKLLKIPIVIKRPSETIDNKKKIELFTIELFQEINLLGNYTDSNWFYNLNKAAIIIFLRELYDIWNYRAQLTTIIKREIIYPHGNPFMGYNLRLLNHMSIDELQLISLNIIANFIRLGNSPSNKSLGAYYILSALTLVSQPARDSMPWLYEAVLYNTGILLN